MKKIFILLFSLMATTVSVMAQIDVSKTKDDGFGQRSKTDTKSGIKNSTDQKVTGKRIDRVLKHYNYELSIGPRLAFGTSSLAEADGLSIADGGAMGYALGLSGNVRFGSKDSRGRYLDGQGLIGIGVELNYKQHSMKIKEGNDNLSMAYFEVPVLLQIYPLYNSKQLKNLYIELGPTIAGTMSSKPDNVVVNKLVYATGDLKGFDVKATIGVGYRFNKMSANDGFYINGRYYMGTSKLAGNFPGKINSAEISVGYNFKCIGTKK